MYAAVDRCAGEGSTAGGNQQLVHARGFSATMSTPMSMPSLQLAAPTAFEPKAAVLEGIRWLIDQDPLTVPNRLIV
jgi:hypothetical protein